MSIIPAESNKIYVSEGTWDIDKGTVNGYNRHKGKSEGGGGAGNFYLKSRGIKMKMGKQLAYIKWLVPIFYLLFSGSCGLFNSSPVINGIELNQSWILVSRAAQIKCVATDKEGDDLTYQWSATGGSFSSQGAVATWKAPDVPGSYSIKVKVKDAKGGEASKEIPVQVTVNRPPVIESLAAEPSAVGAGKTSILKCIAHDPEGEKLSYQWSASGGTISGEGDNVQWMAPQNSQNTFNVTVKVADETGAIASMRIYINVLPNHPPVIASLKSQLQVVTPDGTSEIECIASDVDGDELSYKWEATSGELSGDGSKVIWTASGDCGTSSTITAKVSDSRGGEAEQQVKVKVVSKGG